MATTNRDVEFAHLWQHRSADWRMDRWFRSWDFKEPERHVVVSPRVHPWASIYTRVRWHDHIVYVPSCFWGCECSHVRWA